MPSLGPAEILVILVVALLVFGPDKMPEIGRQLVRGVREFRRVQQHLGSELRGVVSEFDVGADDDSDDATTNRPRPGGDPVPTLPAKGVEARPASAEDPPSAASPATGPNPPPPHPAPPPSPGVEANGGSPPPQPSDST
jgi:sec-independent protein translocase protein TatA